jgi:GT2 family glycosyltransferase
LLFFPNQNDPDRPAGKVQSAGLFFDATGEPYHPFSGWDENEPLVNVVRDVNATTGATFLIRRNVWQQLKGFSLDYGRGTWEDVDISFRTRLLGLKIRVLPQAVGFHYTNLSVLGDKQGFPLNHNRDIFKAKFAQIIPYDSWIQSGIFYDD